ncbi:MAG: 50S ribosomal protein L24 [Clostridia bacterium]|nr:50S ribosomal protein L24 [Clostridia bacterium]
MKNIHVKKDDTVIVISGDDKGKQGKVLEVSVEEGKVIVEGINVQKKHVKPRKQGDEGGIINVEGAMYADKVMLYCPTCKAGRRYATKVENDEKVRVCVKCGTKL